MFNTQLIPLVEESDHVEELQSLKNKHTAYYYDM